MSRVTIQSRAHWHALRRNRIGASDVAALFGVGFRSLFELWHEKRGTLPPADLSDEERVIIGRNLEDGIAGAAGELYGIELRKADFYLLDDTTPGLGATLDYELVEHGNAFPAEIKNASWGAWRDNWITHEDGLVEPPLRYLLQVQAQLMCAQVERGVLIALISGDRIVRCPIERHDDAIAEIRRRVGLFWKSIADDEAPPAELPRDLDAAKKVWTAGEGAADLTGDPDVEEWLKQIGDLRDGKRRIDTEIDTVEGRVLNYCVTNKFASIRAGNGRISCKQREARAARMVEYKPQPARVELRITTSR